MSIPRGLIAIWSGTLASIPDNWVLCDGNNDTPNLIARFVRGAPSYASLGATGGSDSHNHTKMKSEGSHTHTLQSRSHSHTLISGGAHNHDDWDYTATKYGYPFARRTAIGGHTHTTDSKNHSHALESTGTAHTHTINDVDGRPPYYEVAFIQADTGAAVETGLIIIWTGNIIDIPDGWELCDGNGKPDLRSRFLRGVTDDETDPGSTGGNTEHNHTAESEDHTHDISPVGTHTHSVNYHNWSHNHNLSSGAIGGSLRVEQDAASGPNHNHTSTGEGGGHDHNGVTNSGGPHTHTINNASSLPIYYTVAYIINVSSSAIPVGGIFIWTDAIASRPSGYEPCDGSEVDIPDLRGKFLYGAAIGNDPGDEGGSDTHKHTDEDNSSTHNNHFHSTDGAHGHGTTGWSGSHSHSWKYTVDSGTSGSCRTYTRGSHTHSYQTDDDAHTHTVTSAGIHNHSPWTDEEEGRPAYYEVAFVMLVEEPTIELVKYWDGLEWKTPKAIKHYDGATLQPVKAVHRWDGTQWKKVWEV